MRLFAERGYAVATNAVIAEAAGLTRGAMLYHFATRESLVEAVVEHLQAERMRLLAAAADAAPAGADRTDHAIDSYWRLLRTPAFVAFAELEAAARTDPAVAERVAPAQDAFDRAQGGGGVPAGGAAVSALIQAGAAPRFQASRDLARFLLEGMARTRLTHDEAERVERLLQVVKRAVHGLNRKGPPQDLWPE